MTFSIPRFRKSPISRAFLPVLRYVIYDNSWEIDLNSSIIQFIIFGLISSLYKFDKMEISTSTLGLVMNISLSHFASKDNISFHISKSFFYNYLDLFEVVLARGPFFESLVLWPFENSIEIFRKEIKSSNFLHNLK